MQTPASPKSIIPEPAEEPAPQKTKPHPHKRGSGLLVAQRHHQIDKLAAHETSPAIDRASRT
ncbi:hypothetical protein BSQ44_14300 [Aquibium oceanicum]|uniref:Uncharacterized protein n=1 Tax=Aquibium oceanicum TaxID=1670800 RepID=A0A1L3SSL2_9HYPH|nr:hypothetical protein BSQ44_14300 [Aquibium oceanicum]